MVKLVDKQNIFNHGILSSKLFSRDDLKQYMGGVADALNFVCSRYGPLEKRVGTRFIWDLENPGEEVFFLPFVFSVKQSVLLEFLPGKIRFYTFDGEEFGPVACEGAWWQGGNSWVYTDDYNPHAGSTVYSDMNKTTPIGTVYNVGRGSYNEAVVIYLNSSSSSFYIKQGKAYELTTTFTAAQIKDISYVQSLDVIYLAFADRHTPPYMLSRYANNMWTLTPFVTEDGPYLDTNYDVNKKMTISGTSTSSSTVTLTGFTLSSADVGRWIRICTPRYNEHTYTYEDKWSYGKISAVAANGASITVNWSYRNSVSESDQSWMTTATSEWRLGVWHTGTGNSNYPVTYPTKVSIHQQRLVWAGMTDKPWVWMSNSYAYKNYAPSDYEGVISDTNAIYLDVSTDKVSDIFWMKSVKHLLLGTELGELRIYSSGTALTPSDAVSNRESSYGSHDAEPVVNDDNIVFIQRLQRTLRSLSYDDNKLAYVGPELTILAENLTAGGIKKIAFQKEPNNTYWCLKEDGTLLTLTYDASQDVIGWSKSQLAGDAKVIDIAVLPSSTYQQDMVLLAVERVMAYEDVMVDGEIEHRPIVKRYLELLSKNFIPDMPQEDALFLDCAMPHKNNPGLSRIEGLDYLEGQTVVAVSEGSYVGTFTVTDGAIEMPYPCSYVWVGLPYESYFETLERDYQDKQISTKMSKLRVYKLRMYLDRTIGLSLYRLDRGSTTRLVTFNPASNMDQMSELITGKVTIEVPSAWDCDYRLKVISDVGMPCTVSGITIGLELNEI